MLVRSPFLYHPTDRHGRTSNSGLIVSKIRWFAKMTRARHEIKVPRACPGSRRLVTIGMGLARIGVNLPGVDAGASSSPILRITPEFLKQR
jgi:hypothetical protein